MNHRIMYSMRYPPIPTRLFADRRRALMRRMKKGSIAVLGSNDQLIKSGDQHFPFRQHSDLFRLSGIEQPETFLVLDPSAADPLLREQLFLLPRNPVQETWTGQRLSAGAARRISGISSVYSHVRWEKTLAEMLSRTSLVYTNRPLPDPDAPSNSPVMARLQMAFGPTGDQRLRRIDELLTPLSMVKHPVELSLMRTAVKVTEGAFRRVLETLTPGVAEYVVEAEITHHFTTAGCAHAYDPIIASGASACTLHYTANNKVLRPGSLVLLDFGAAHAHMASDLSRTLPVSGRFTVRQRTIYMAVLRVLQETTTMMRPGMTLPDLNREAGRLIDRELVRLKLATSFEIRRQSREAPVRRRYFMHGIGHHLGFDVHDAGDRHATFKPGMVITCEPGLYIREEKTGVRLENDILITRDEPENLMRHIPIDPDEIESLLHRA